MPPRSLWPRLLVLGVGCLCAGLLLALLVAFQERWVSFSDYPYNEWFHQLGARNLVLHDLAEGLRRYGSGRWGTPLVLAFAVVLMAFRRWRWTVFVLACAAGGYVISNVAKFAVSRARPPWAELPGISASTSFPSGHTFTGATTWVAIGVVLLFVLPRPYATILGWLAIVFGVVIGPSRWILGQHWITDVIGAWLLGLGWVLLVSAVLLRWWGPDPMPRPDASSAVLGQ